MKRSYITPSMLIVALNGGNICQTLLVGSVGQGEDYVKQDVSNNASSSSSSTGSSGYNVWDDDWSK